MAGTIQTQLLTSDQVAGYLQCLVDHYPGSETAGGMRYWNVGIGALGQGVMLTYSFMTAVPYYEIGNPDITGFEPMTAAEKTAARSVFNQYAAICNLSFTELPDPGSSYRSNLNYPWIRLGVCEQTDSGGFTVDGSTRADQSGDPSSADIYMDKSSYSAEEIAGCEKGGWGYETFVHEIGHALGLKHPGDYNAGGGGTPGPYLPEELDNTQYTVMSYNEPTRVWRLEFVDTGTSVRANFREVSDQTPMVLDIALLQYLYGANLATASGDDVYTFNPTSFGGGTGALPFRKTIWDAGGHDLIDCSAIKRSNLIDLRPGAYSSIDWTSNPMDYFPDWVKSRFASWAAGLDKGSDFTLYDGRNNLGIAYGAVIENAYGGAGADVIIGNDAANILKGNGGNDTLDGGAGADTMFGGAGDDLFMVTDGDVVSEMAGEGVDTLRSYGLAVTYVMAAQVENFELLGGNGGVARVLGNDLANVIGGGDGADTLAGGAGNDRLVGGGGNDTLDGGAGNDTLEGGLGDDVYIWSDTGDTVNDAGGFDTLRTALNVFILGQPGVERLEFIGPGAFTGTGNDLANVVVGGDGDDVLDGGGGIDTLIGGRGDDTYVVDRLADRIMEQVGEGTDTVTSAVLTVLDLQKAGWSGIETLAYTGLKSCTLLGTAGIDHLVGGGGADRLEGRGGLDRLEGGAGDDCYVVDASGEVSEAAGAGTDTVVTVATAYALDPNVENLVHVGAGNFFGTGNGLGNWIRAGAGNDTLDGGAGRDTLDGGSGDDVYLVDNPGDKIVDSSGLDEVRTSLNTFSLAAASTVETLTYCGAGSFFGSGNQFANTLTGGGGADILDGGKGNDLLIGGGGNDILIGGLGTDTAVVQGNAADYVISRTGSALVTLVGGATITLSGVESVLFDDGERSIADLLLDHASDWSDRFVGTAGADVMAGGKGDDVYTVNGAGDQVIEAAGGGTDTVLTDLSSYALPDYVEAVEFVGSGAFAGFGNGLANTITGGAGADLLDGSGGADVLKGLAGDDLYVIDNAWDRIVDTAGIDEIRTSLGSLKLPSQIENLTFTGTGRFLGIGNDSGNVICGALGADTLSGGAGDDTLVGGEGRDSLDGGTGNDTLIGGDGADTLTGGSGADRFVFSSPAGGGDVITDFRHGVDRILLDATAFGAGLHAGPVESGAFTIGAAAQEADDRFGYDPLLRKLWFDPDGSGPQGRGEVCGLAKGGTLGIEDLLLF